MPTFSEIELPLNSMPEYSICEYSINKKARMLLLGKVKRG
jgi:hypothetical protein